MVKLEYLEGNREEILKEIPIKDYFSSILIIMYTITFIDYYFILFFNGGVELVLLF